MILKACLHTLSDTSLLSYQNNAPPHSQTCQWILTHPTYLTFLTSPRPILYLKGHPGTGKSTLISYLLTHHLHLTSNTRLSLTLSFFFSASGSPLQKSQLGFYRSLLWQLYLQSLSSRRIILGSFDVKRKTCKEGWEWDVDELKELFLKCVGEKVEGREVMIFVDALDELEEGTEDLVEVLNGLVGGGEGNVRVVGSCRHYPVLATGKAGVIRVEEANWKDIECFVEGMLERRVEDWSEIDGVERTRLVRALVIKADGVFLWAKLRVGRVVRDLNDGVEVEDVKRLVEEESNELFGMYERVLLEEVEVSRRKIAVELLSWVGFAEKPLTVGELRYALACGVEDGGEGWKMLSCEENPRFIKSDKSMEKLIRSLSGGLAEVRRSGDEVTVHVFHQSVRDFLRGGGLRGLMAAGGSSGPTQVTDDNLLVGKCEESLSRACINYLRILEFQFKFSESSEGFETEFIFVEYAAKYWTTHAEHAEMLGVPQIGLAEIFDSIPSFLETWKMIYRTLKTSDSRRPDLGSTLLHIASCCNLKSLACRLLEQDTSRLEQINDNSETPLHLAAQRGHEELVKKYLELGASVDVKTRGGQTPLELAALEGHQGTARLLLKKGADANEKTGEAGSALQSACRMGKLPLVAVLINYGADVNFQGGTMGNALQEATTEGYEDIVRLLLANGANVNARGGYCGSALQAAVGAPRANCEKLTEIILRAGGDVNTEGGYHGTALQAAIKLDRQNIIELLLANGADIDIQGGESGNALQAAVLAFNDDLVKDLLRRGAKVNAQGGRYWTALQAAASSGNIEIVELLLDNGADATIRGGYYDNALQAGAGTASVPAVVVLSVVKRLVEKGADLNWKGGHFGSVIQAAAYGGKEEVVQFFLDRGADINEKGGEYGNVLQAAMWLGKDPFLEFLIKKGADVNAKGGEYGTPLGSAVRWEKRGTIRLLLKQGADVNAHFSGRYSNALQIAAHGGNVEILNMLIDAGAEVNGTGGLYGNALQEAVMSRHKEVAELLLESGAKRDLKGGLCGTAGGAATGNISMMKVLATTKRALRSNSKGNLEQKVKP